VTEFAHPTPFGARGSAVVLACLGAPVTLGLVVPSASSRPSFAAPRSFATGKDPTRVAIGDLNGDRLRTARTLI